MSRFDFTATPLAGLTLVQRKVMQDQRGFLSRFFCAEQFREAGFIKPIAQINHTLTHCKGAVRGMHFQYPPHVECKLVSCLSGAIWDVAVDLRRNSPTFMQWHGAVLSAENRSSLLLPEGFAHGYQTLAADCELIYLHTATYHPETVGGLNAMDPALNIGWPLAVEQLSEQDRTRPFIDQFFQGILL